MSKKILVREGAFTQFLQSFFTAKANGKGDDWMDRLEKASPEVAKSWSDFDKTVDKGIMNQYRILKSQGLDTSHLDALVKKYNIKF
jgi:hypothetical protein